jgi:predicted dehydrogenase
MARHSVGIAGLSHDHTWSLIERWMDVPEVEIAGVAEYRPNLQQRLRETHPDIKCFDTVDDMLDSTGADFLQLGGTNVEHAPATESAAKRGVHVHVEKPMAASVDQADRMLKAVSDGGVKMMVNWPTMWRGYIHTMARLCAEGRIGRVFQIKNRGGHEARFTGSQLWFWDREQNGGGASADFCGYGANLGRWLIGPAKGVVALGGTYDKDIEVEDNAVFLIDYGNAMGIAEATWTQVGGHPYASPIIWGTEGILRPGENGVIVQTEGNSEGEFVPADPIPGGYDNGPAYFTAWVDGEIDSLHPLLDPDRSRDVQEIIAAGLTAMAEGRRVDLPISK